MLAPKTCTRITEISSRCSKISLGTTEAPCALAKRSSKRSINHYSSTSAFVKPTVKKPAQVTRALDRKSPLTKALMSLERAVEAKDASLALRISTTLKIHGIRPTTQFYRLLMQVLTEKGMNREASAIFDDAKAIGIEPDREMWNYLLEARAHDTIELSNAVASMVMARHELNATSYRVLIQHYANTRNLLMCLRILQEMKEKDITPDIIAVDATVVLACSSNLTRLGHGLAIDYEQKATRQLPISTWTRILASSAHTFYTAGILEGWQRVAGDNKVTPDEGICTMVINAAGLAGHSELSEKAVKALQTLNVTLREHHIAPWMLALATEGDVSKALDLFDFMEKHGVQPTRFTTRPLNKLLTIPENLESSLHHLRTRVKNGGNNLAAAFNCVLGATLQDRSNRTIALGKEMDELKVVPTIDTFNILIHSACLRHNVPATHAYFEEILLRGLVPNQETYERIIVLLTSEVVYDDAFLYLYKMTSAHLVPSFEVLMGLAKKCSLKHDARWKDLVKQMERYNYVVSDELMNYLAANGNVRLTENTTSGDEDPPSGSTYSPLPIDMNDVDEELDKHSTRIDFA
ncbi:hypothetical protein PIIN_05952 [Serendipita indica DSM 11827]|uniref:Pentatricopeptide repeat-containing protein-mitochondrial domain-containing protein n=1 Tax=Serendipita indica (strain DSM 11827) TaxID=1109443 RepID=G4TL31_SERID|nr:hypothetical protein PIIN_05952 [Serendipita indica DSM 11827]